MTANNSEKLFGPSLKLKSRAFRDRFGTDDELLAQVNTWLEEQSEKVV